MILELSDFSGPASESVFQTCFVVGSKICLFQAVVQSRSIEVELVFQLINFGGLLVDDVEAVLDEYILVFCAWASGKKVGEVDIASPQAQLASTSILVFSALEFAFIEKVHSRNTRKMDELTLLVS